MTPSNNKQVHNLAADTLLLYVDLLDTTVFPALCIYNQSPMKNLIISEKILAKLTNRHKVTEREVEQCFENIDGPLLIDSREDHKSDPPTLWFISRTNKNRLLKVAYIQRGASIYLRTCYEPNDAEMQIYSSHLI